MLTPIQIDNRINAFLGKPAGGGKRPAVIHLHERYGIVQHTTDLGQKFVDAGYVTIVPDLFWRFTGDREALARGDARCDLSDEQVLQDIDLVVAYLRTLPEVDSTKIAIVRRVSNGSPTASSFRETGLSIRRRRVVRRGLQRRLEISSAPSGAHRYPAGTNLLSRRWSVRRNG
jgi:hypothetical protein